MATTKFYLDHRATKPGNPAPLKIALTHKQKTVHIKLNVSLLDSQWDAKNLKVTNHPNKTYLNNYILRRKLDIDTYILQLRTSGGVRGMSAVEIKKHICRALYSEPEEEKKDPATLFAARFRKFAESKKESTQKIYRHTYRRMKAYADDLETLSFEDITDEWLRGFESFLEKTSKKNSRNIHFRNIRAVFNDAINNEITAAYPFRRFKIRPVATAKRSLSAEQLRTLFDYPVEPNVEKYLDMFKLTFFLIGINTIDLCHLKEVRDGRIEYYRSKTGRLYSIKVEPEAMAIIEKYRGENQLLNILDRCSSHINYRKRLNKNLRLIGETTVGKYGKKTVKPLFPEITTYWARHTWATIAAELEIPKETIAAALGHGGNTVTDIYIDFDRKKIDEANRRVIDFVLNKK